MNAADTGVVKRGARAQAQRERILAAAQECFVDHGFDAASMADIARTAGMSPGLMYRYFPSKHAIVLAIIERQLQERRVKIAQLHSSPDIVANLLRSFEQWRSGEPGAMNISLFLSMSADASRDPQIAQALLAADLVSRADFVAWLCRGREDGGLALSSEVAESRAIVMQCVFEGLAIRASREPGLDIRQLEPTLRTLFERLLSR